MEMLVCEPFKEDITNVRIHLREDFVDKTQIQQEEQEQEQNEDQYSHHTWLQDLRPGRSIPLKWAGPVATRPAASHFLLQERHLPNRQSRLVQPTCYGMD